MPRRPSSLAHGRPGSKYSNNTLTKPKSSIAAKHTRRLIRQHHTLQKQHAAAVKAGDQELAASIAGQIEDAGGLKQYQLASKTGQSRERGGDASAVLVQWLEDGERRGSVMMDGDAASGKRRWRMLDVGALTCDTAASGSGIFDEIVRIDLHSQEKGITKQDFTERPLPKDDGDRFDVVSLSLVLNYVPDPEGRGEMLRRASHFLRQSCEAHVAQPSQCFNRLFVVLPAPCVTNSRYLTVDHFEQLMRMLGYEMLQKKISAKLAYFLCTLKDPHVAIQQQTKKCEINPGRARNNFAICI